MKNILNNNWLITIIGGVVASIVVLYFWQTKPRLIYTLNEPLDFLVSNGKTTSQSSVQQLIVTNAGTAAAKDIVIRFKHPVHNAIIKKYSQADNARSIPKDLPIEIDYPALPPGTSFTVSFSPKNTVIDKDSLAINHSEGAAEEAALAAQPKPIDYFSRYLYWAVISLYLFLSLNDTRKWRVKHWWQYPDVKSVGKLLEMRRPWYFTPSEFKHLLPKAIRKFVQQYSDVDLITGDVESSVAHHVLNAAPPNSIGADEWHSIVAEVSKLFEQLFDRRLTSSYYPERALRLTQLPKPRSISDECWQELQKKAHQKVVSLFEDSIKYYDTGLSILQGEKPESLYDEEWERIRQSALSEQMRKEIPYLFDTQGVRKFVAAGKPQWLPEEHFDKLVKHDEDNKAREEREVALQQSAEASHTASRERIRRYDTYLDVCRSLFVNNFVPLTRPEGFPEADWNQLRLMENQMKIIRAWMQQNSGDQKSNEALAEKQDIPLQPPNEAEAPS